jgi:hypothetical protein
MPIIYTYPSTTPTAADLITISSAGATPANSTRTCTIGDIVTLVGALVPGGGTVTSVGLDFQATGLTTSGGASQTITTTGVFTVGGTLVVANGGTGAGALTGVIHGNGSGAYTASNVDLTSEVTGTLPALNGGTGNAVYAIGDILYASGTTTLTRLPGAGAGALVLTSGGVGVAPSWAAIPTDAVLSVTADTVAASTGLPLTIAPTTGAVLVKARSYAGTSNVGYVPTGGGATTFLRGDGTWVIPTNETYDLNATTDGSNVDINLTSTSGSDNSVIQLTAGTNITLTRNSAAEVTIDSPLSGSGIYGGSGSLSGATVVTSGANDLTFTATTGDVIFNNDVAPNPAMIIDGATNSIGMGGTFEPADQLAISNQSSSGNTTALGIYGSNPSGAQKGMEITMSGAGTSNTALHLVAAAAATNYALTTRGGFVGLGTETPEAQLHTDGNISSNILSSSSNSAAQPVTLDMRKSRGTTASRTDVQSGDQIGIISFSPYFDDFDNQAASITASATGVMGTNITPGLLTFNTTPVGSNTPTMAMTIDSTQSMGVGTDAPHASAKLHVNTVTEGFLPPVMTTAQKNAISTPAEGLIVYDATLSKLCVYTGAAWETITSA